jgi:hypothetical protein
LATNGCGIVDLGNYDIGIIEYSGMRAEISVPDVVQAGTDFTVTLETFGGGCVGRSHTRVDAIGSNAIVTPVDEHSGADDCTADLVILDHSTSLRFEDRGAASVIIRGRVEPPGDVVERTFAVSVE